MKCSRSSPVERYAMAVIVGVLLAWALYAYVRALFDSEDPPALHGVGLGVTVLNVVMLVLLVGGMRVGRTKEPRWRMASIFLLAGAAAASVAFYGIEPDFGAGFVFAMIALWALFTRLPLTWGIAASAVTIVAVAVLGELFRDDGADLGLLIAFMGVTLGAAASRRGIAAQEATRRAEAANAVLAERSHIAREIHDILAHSLSAQIVHLEGARLLLSRDGDRVQALDRVERARNLARSGLEETRRALATLRGEIPEPKEVIAELAEESMRARAAPATSR